MAKHIGSKIDVSIAERMGDPAFAASFRLRRLSHEIAIAVRSMRESAGLTQDQLAKLVDTSQPSIARIERSADRFPRWDMLDRIAAALGRQLQLSFVDAKSAEPPVKVRRRKRSSEDSEAR